jgi:hypothetical protein
MDVLKVALISEPPRTADSIGSLVAGDAAMGIKQHTLASSDSDASSQ